MIPNTLDPKSFAEIVTRTQTYLKEIEEKIQKIAKEYLKDSKVSDRRHFIMTNPLIKFYQNSFVWKFKEAVGSLPNNYLDKKRVESIFEQLINQYNREIEGIALNLSGQLCDSCLEKRF